MTAAAGEITRPDGVVIRVGDRVRDLRREFGDEHGCREGVVTGVLLPSGCLYVRPDPRFDLSQTEFNVAASSVELWRDENEESAGGTL